MRHHDCAFCDRKKFEERIIAETKDWYVIATLGQITDGGYVLVFPRRHIRCMGALSEQKGISLRKILRESVFPAIRQEYQQETKKFSNPFTVFEHGVGGQTVPHAHLHIVPADISFTNSVQMEFPNTKMQDLTCAEQLQTFYQENKPRVPYLFWTNGRSNAKVCWNPRARPQYLRVLAANLLGRPERGDWRFMDPELDRRLWQETVMRLRKHFK